MCVCGGVLYVMCVWGVYYVRCVVVCVGMLCDVCVIKIVPKLEW